MADRKQGADWYSGSSAPVHKANWNLFSDMEEADYEEENHNDEEE